MKMFGLIIFMLSVVGVRGSVHKEICHSVDFNQTIDVDDPSCGPPRVLLLPNKKCLGVCPNVFEPNLSMGQGEISRTCKMCKPVLVTATLKLACGLGKILSLKVKQVSDCKCEDVDCECPTRFTHL